MTRAEEVAAKLESARAWLAGEGLRGLLLQSPGGFAWATAGGDNTVTLAAERGPAAVLVTPDAAVLLTDNVEAPRLQTEVVEGLGFPVATFPWWAGSIPEAAAARVPLAELAADVPVDGARLLRSADLLRLRGQLLPPEVARYRALGEETAVVLTHAAFHCRPGLSERQVAGMLARGLQDFGIAPALTLAGVDERALRYRHPVPTGARLREYLLFAVTGRRSGLHVSATRAVHFGPLPPELTARHAACARVDAAYLSASRPGAPLAEVFRAGQAAYAAEGVPEGWQHHHQGGPTGYAGREVKVGPGTPGQVGEAQAFAWNPTLPGVKCEDTVLVSAAGVDVLTRTRDLPELLAGGRPRAAILER